MSILHYDPIPPRVTWDDSFSPKIMLATTAYDSPDAGYTHAMAASRSFLKGYGYLTAYLLLQGDCHVDDARNRVVAHFLASDCDSLVFIDSDVTWEPKGLLDIIRERGDIVGGVYPHRIDGDRGAFPAEVLPGANPNAGLLAMAHIPTGFMRIARKVLEEMAADCEHYAGQDGTVTPLLFERITKDGGRIGGDVNFCRKARKLGFHCNAVMDLRLGHAFKTVRHDNLAGMMRWRDGTVLRDVCEKVGGNTADVWDYQDARDWVGGRFVANLATIGYAIGLARKAEGPILEAGSGLTTILMAAATDEMVYCLEHDPHHAEATRRLAFEAGVQDNIAICHAPLVNGWYDEQELDGLPEKFAFGLIDGPPRQVSDRAKFFDVMGGKCRSILCDDADSIEAAAVAYSGKRGWSTLAHRGQTMLIGKGTP